MSLRTKGETMNMPMAVARSHRACPFVIACTSSPVESEMGSGSPSIPLEPVYEMLALQPHRKECEL